jgi:hypothetical protein
MWVSAKGQTLNIDGLTINSLGRGIKIDEQYVGDPAKVVMNINNATFTTAKKAAILVKSVAGAEINALNLNITNVAEDQANAVWIDEDAAAYYDLVTVKGCYKIIEGSVRVTTVAGLNEVNVGTAEAIIILGEGNFGTIAATSNKTYIGQEGAQVDCINLNGADNVTIKNITFDAATAVLGCDGKGTTKQYANIITGQQGKNNAKGANNLTIDGCVFVGKFDNGGVAVAFTDQGRSSGQSGNITIKNCKFEVEGANAYIYMHYSGKGFFNIEDNLFASNTFSNPIYLGRYQSSTPVVLKNNVFEKVSTLEDAIYVQAHSETYNVSVDASNNTFAE